MNIKITLKHITQKQIFIVASLLLAAFLQFYADTFCYFRPLMLEEPWRFVTAHWVHVSWTHYLMNAFALACLPFIFPNFNVKWLVITSIGLAILLSLIFYVYYPTLSAYAGFSGVLHGLYVFAACVSLHSRCERGFALIVLLGLIIKLIWEANLNAHTSITAQLIGTPVFFEAHQFGGLFGFMMYLLAYFITHKFD